MQASTEEINSVIDRVKISKLKKEPCGPYTIQDLIKVLQTYCSDEKFVDLLEETSSLLNLRHCELLKNASDCEDLVISLYKYAYYNRKKVFPEVFEFLRSRIKQIFPTIKELPLSAELRKKSLVLVDKLKQQLKNYESEHLHTDDNKITARWRTDINRVSAYKALIKASAHNQAFIELIITINQYRSEIGYDDREHFRSGLQQYCQEFIEAAKQFFNDFSQQRDDLIKEDQLVLEDFFFSLDNLNVPLIPTREQKPVTLTPKSDAGLIVDLKARANKLLLEISVALQQYPQKPMVIGILFWQKIRYCSQENVNKLKKDCINWAQWFREVGYDDCIIETYYAIAVHLYENNQEDYFSIIKMTLLNWLDITDTPSLAHFNDLHIAVTNKLAKYKTIYKINDNYCNHAAKSNSAILKH